jgi:hypothetical protein
MIYIKACFLALFHTTVTFPGSKVTFEQRLFSTNQQSAKKNFKNDLKSISRKVPIYNYIDLFWMLTYPIILNTVVLLTPPKHRSPFGTTCGHLQTIVPMRINSQKIIIFRTGSKGNFLALLLKIHSELNYNKTSVDIPTLMK